MTVDASGPDDIQDLRYWQLRRRCVPQPRLSVNLVAFDFNIAVGRLAGAAHSSILTGWRDMADRRADSMTLRQATASAGETGTGAPSIKVLAICL